MTLEFNPYQAPEARVVEDFITVTPARRTVARFMMAASCWSVAGCLLCLFIMVFYLTITYPINFPGRYRSLRVAMVLVPMASSTIAFAFSGRSFWRGHDRHGIVFTIVAVGLLALILLGPLIFL